jgi:hypothetical protein
MIGMSFNLDVDVKAHAKLTEATKVEVEEEP